MEALAKTRTGRPLKFGSAAALQEAVDAYFKACDEASEPHTVTASLPCHWELTGRRFSTRNTGGTQVPRQARIFSFPSPVALLFDRPAEGKGLRSALG